MTYELTLSSLTMLTTLFEGRYPQQSIFFMLSIDIRIMVYFQNTLGRNYCKICYLQEKKMYIGAVYKTQPCYIPEERDKGNVFLMIYKKGLYINFFLVFTNKLYILESVG